MPELQLMRHAKSDWHTHVDDLERPLNERGRADAVKMAHALKAVSRVPDCVLVSPAQRTQETLERLLSQWQGQAPRIVTDKTLYLAAAEVLLEMAALYIDSHARLMVLAHNPGMDIAVSQISRQPPPLTRAGKLMVTAAVACFALEQAADLQKSGKCDLIQLLRPSDLAQG